MEQPPGPLPPPSPPPTAPSADGSIDLSLHIGPARSRRRRRRRRSSVGSPVTPPSSSTSASSSSSTEESPAAAAIAASDVPATLGAPHAPYSPSDPLFSDSLADPRPISGVGDGPVGAYSPLSPSYQTHMPYEPHPPAGLPEEPLLRGGSGARGDSSHVPYSPPYAPFSATPPGHDDVAFASYEPVYAPVEANLGDGDRVSPLNGLSEEEFRIRMLIELRRRLQSVRQFRSAVSSIRTTEQLVHSAASSGEGREDPAKSGAGIAGVPSIEGLEEEKKDGGSGAAEFECNICLEVAKKPVVTCCGHLFCWPCLYQWLHLYCSHRECPVCKGEVDESSITPIYGRGRSEAASEEEQEGDAGGGTGLSVPPMPRGRRVESWRQRMPTPTARRFRGGIAGSWMYLLGEQFWNRTRAAGHWVPNLQENAEEEHRRGFNRSRRRTSARVWENPEDEHSGVGNAAEAAGEAAQNGVGTSSYNPDGVHWDWPHLNTPDRSTRLAAFTARLSRIFNRSAASRSLDRNHSGGPPLSATPQDPDDPVARRSSNAPSSRGVDRFSTPSTVAVIQGDAGVAEAMAEPSTAGSSRALGRRGSSSFSGSSDADFSGSSDADGCLLHACKRRRLN